MCIGINYGSLFDCIMSYYGDFLRGMVSFVDFFECILIDIELLWVIYVFF